MNLRKNIFLIIIVYLTLQSCGIYSFTGASLHKDDKTLTVKFFPNRARIVNPNLSQTFTDALKDKFVSQVGLELTENNGDLQFEGEITGYRTEPISIVLEGTTEKASRTKLTISIRVKYTSINNPEYSFDNTISKYSDFDAEKSLVEVEDELVTTIIEELTDEIFNKAVINW